MSENLQIKEVADRLILIGADVRCITGTITRDDRRAEDDAKVFTSGAVRYISPAALRPFTSARMATTRVCRAHGTRFWGAWAIAEESLPFVAAELERIAAHVNKNKEDLIARWGSELAAWEEVHPAAGAYRARFPKAADAEKGISISVSAVRIAHAGPVVAGATDAVAEEVGGMSRRILEEIAADVRDSWSPAAMKATQAIKGLLRRISNKCRTLSFVGGNLAEVAVFVEEAIARLPQTGEITGNDYVILSGILSLLERPEVIASGDFHFSAKLAEEEEAVAQDEPVASEKASNPNPIVVDNGRVIEVEPTVTQAVPAESKQVGPAYAW